MPETPETPKEHWYFRKLGWPRLSRAGSQPGNPTGHGMAGGRRATGREETAALREHKESEHIVVSGPRKKNRADAWVMGDFYRHPQNPQFRHVSTHANEQEAMTAGKRYAANKGLKHEHWGTTPPAGPEPVMEPGSNN